jgi:uncharacterized protein (DUF433 family)
MKKTVVSFRRKREMLIPELNQGVYTLAEAAQYTHVPVSTLSSWFRQRPDKKGRGPIFKSDWIQAGGDFALSFFNLIEAYVASFLKNHGAKPNDIRRANEILKAELGVEHPFAHARLRTAMGRIIHENRASKRKTGFVDIISKQLFFPQFKRGLTKIVYNTTTRLAEAWKIAKGIIVRPTVGFGKPVIKDTGVSTVIVANQYWANGKNASLVARLFNIPEAGVKNAFRFEKIVIKRFAA